MGNMYVCVHTSGIHGTDDQENIHYTHIYTNEESICSTPVQLPYISVSVKQEVFWSRTHTCLHLSLQGRETFSSTHASNFFGCVCPPPECNICTHVSAAGANTLHSQTKQHLHMSLRSCKHLLNSCFGTGTCSTLVAQVGYRCSWKQLSRWHLFSCSPRRARVPFRARGTQRIHVVVPHYFFWLIFLCIFFCTYFYKPPAMTNTTTQ